MPSRVGIFGGSFDPPHLGHLIAAQAAAEQCDLDLVLWVPTGESYHKDGTSAATDRLEMVRLAVAGNPLFAVSTVDIDRPGPTYTIDTVTDMRRHYPEAEFTLILGTDAYQSIATWRRSDELLSAVSLAVVSRETARNNVSASTSVRWVQIPSIGISSSECRARARVGKSLMYLAPPAVEQYISAQHLYSENHEPRV